MHPDRPAARRVETEDGFPLAPLFLREKSIAHDDDRRPGRPDPLPPDQFRQSGIPIGCDADASQSAVAIRATKAGPIAGPELQGLSRDRWRGRLACPLYLRNIDLLGREAPPPAE